MAIELDSAPFDVLIGEEVFALIVDRAPTKVRTRVLKALEHYGKAERLDGIDDEMGAMRLIAAEEELVVAIFEWLKLNADHMPAHRDFVGKFKNHVVKLSFYPVMMQFAWLVGEWMEDGITVEGLEDVVDWNVSAVVQEGRVKLRVVDETGKELIHLNPLDVAITRSDIAESDVHDALYRQFQNEVQRQRNSTVKAFITERADFRNKLLYAEDGRTLSLGESVRELIDKSFAQTMRTLLWALAVLLTNRPMTSEWGLVNQFVALYRRVLVEAKVLNGQGD